MMYIFVMEQKVIKAYQHLKNIMVLLDSQVKYLCKVFPFVLQTLFYLPLFLIHLQKVVNHSLP